ncbi:hypothetical protein ZEAMMB73_Zm00001d018831 [Zea mays]|uniref:P-loop containing nucleoside triphosphate hydrolase superfamily protein n=1 Tax=Zea mays TaxID=4577 RepID=A0A1D6HSM7_MAIZE|nr:hypothetical protein ZEAMMB73_Zm00001d018831 [Zea mays]
MAGGHPAPLRPVVVAMKGHPGSGKSTAARAIATALCCPLLDKDDVRDCMLPLEGLAAAGMLNDLSYAVLWRMAERQPVCLWSSWSVALVITRNGAGGWRAVGRLLPMVAVVMDGISQRHGLSWRGFWKGTKVAQTMKLGMYRGL